MTKAEVMDLTTICQSFPEIPEPCIPRENILDTIDRIFEGGTELVVVEGVGSIGKTILLAQFANRHPDHTFSLFVRPASRWAYDPAFLRFDLCNQLEWAIFQEELRMTEAADDTFLGDRLLKLHRRARRKKETFYFLVDGLHNVPEEDAQIRELVLDMLPFGLKGFCFLVAGELEQIPRDMREGVRHKSFPLSGFTPDETARYLADLEIGRESLEEIHRTCKGIPGNLASVRRILLSGVDVQNLLDEMPDKLPNLFQIEWRKVKTDDDRQLKLLAVLAHDRKRHSIEDLVQILGLEAATIRDLLQDLGFVEIDPQSHEIGFVSEAFRGFAAVQLQHLKRTVHDLLISHLFADPDSDAALTYLPSYLEQAGRFEDLLNYLSPDNFTKMLQISQSLSPVQQKAELGVNAAYKLRRDGDLMRFGVQKSVMTGLDGAVIWQSEVEARMALKDYESAIALAQSAVLKEERLHLLALIAKAEREQGLSPEGELIEQIRQLYTQVDLTSLGSARAIDLASDLLYSTPDLAIELVEKATDTGREENALDWALAKFSIAALDSDNEPHLAADTVEGIRSRIKDPKVRRFSTEVSLLIGEYSAGEVIRQVEKLSGTDDRLYLLSRWAMDNREREDAAEVVEFALDLAIKATPYSPNATIFRQIATPLPFIPDESKTRTLVRSFDAQKGTVERYGPSEDFVRLQLLLAQAESKHNIEAAYNRVIEVYSYILDLEDLATKTASMARLAATLVDLDSELNSEDRDQIHTLVQDNLRKDVNLLLDATAEHYYATRNIIRALAKAKPEMALELAMALNTEARRDLALLNLVESASQIQAAKLDLRFLNRVIDQFVDQDLRDEACLQVIVRLSLVSERMATLVENALPLIHRIEDIQDARERSNACCLAYAFLMKQDPERYSGLMSHLLKLLQSAWQSIDVGWDKIDVGFKITRSLAKYTLETAQTYLGRAERHREEILLDANLTARVYLACLRLAVRAYSGLLPRKIDSEDDLESLAQLIEHVPSHGERASLWAELALRHQFNGQLNECRRIVTERVKPLLLGISNGDAKYRGDVIVVTAPALYYAHKQTALELISELPVHPRDEAYARICETILRKRPLSEPYDYSKGQGYDVTYEDIVDICDLLHRMDNDSHIYHFVECISDSVTCRHRKDRFSRQQRADIVVRLEGVVNDKLPSERHIKHAGYKIGAQAQIARIQRASPQVWLNLADSARKIPNLADRVLVLCMIAAAMPTKGGTRRKELLEEAKQLIERIPTDLDRIERYEDLASTALNIDRGISRESLELAMKYAVDNDRPELYPVQRRIIDLAYKLDENLAASLVSMADDDPARNRTRTNLRQRFQILNLKKKMADSLMSGKGFEPSSDSDYPKAAWMLLGALNAGRVAPASLNRTRDFIRVASNLPFSQSYPMLAWAIENANRRYANTDQARTYLRPIYKAMLLGAELAARMAARSSMHIERVKRHVVRPSDAKSVLVRAGERERAIQFLRNWFEREVRDYLKICDPFFGPDDLEILQILRSVNPTCKVLILTSKKHQEQERVTQPWSDTYLTHWRIRISDQAPPDTEIVIVGTESTGELPIHDRWWLTNGAGIRIGTSFNSLGVGRDSEISYLSEDEARVRETQVDRYLQRIEREHKGDKLLYSLFTL